MFGMLALAEASQYARGIHALRAGDERSVIVLARSEEMNAREGI